jgi:two-component system cell cycle sensor histidine kinase/response regulator CckA
VTQQLLAYSGQRTVDLRIVEPGDLVLAARRLLDRLLGEDISIELNIEPDVGVVRVDPSQLEEVLINLAINARDAMPCGGVLRFEVCRADVRRPNEESVPYYVPPGDYVAIRVQDTGIGMAPDVLARVFEPFFTTKGPLKGTGLGLSTAYGIVKQSGGFIWAQSRVGEGTVFHLLMPAEDGPPDLASPARTISGLPAGLGRIFLVEDDTSVRRYCIRVMEQAGFEVSGFGRPEEALGAFTAVAPKIDLLVTDVVMPGMSGPELVAGCRAIRPGIPVLYLTGYTGDALRERGLQSATENILQKPVTPVQLLAAVGRSITAGSGDEHKDG